MKDIYLIISYQDEGNKHNENSSRTIELVNRARKGNR